MRFGEGYEVTSVTVGTGSRTNTMTGDRYEYTTAGFLAQ